MTGRKVNTSLRGTINMRKLFVIALVTIATRLLRRCKNTADTCRLLSQSIAQKQADENCSILNTILPGSSVLFYNKLQ